MALAVIEGTRAEDMRRVFEKAMEKIDDCDGVVILMQSKSEGMWWFAPDSMKLETLIFYCWTIMRSIGL